MQALEQAFMDRAGRKLPKVDLAYGLIDLLDEDPNVRLLDPRRIDAVREVARSIVAAFAARERR